MRFSRFLVFALLLSPFVSSALAQEPIRLQFEIIKDGSTVARPEVTVVAGTAGVIEVDGVGRLEFTPTRRSSESLAIAFVIHAGEKKFEPSLVISKNQSGTLSWTSETRAQSVTVRVSWFQEVVGPE